MSNAFMALIWWVIPLAGLIGALGYVLWVTQFKSKFESETTRSVGQFQRFQDSFRDAEITIAGEEPDEIKDALPPLER
jgi:DNA polymerase/3'-5' exonuclease PolX